MIYGYFAGTCGFTRLLLLCSSFAVGCWQLALQKVADNM